MDGGVDPQWLREIICLLTRDSLSSDEDNGALAMSGQYCDLINSPIFDRQQFTTPDAQTVSGFTWGQLKGVLDRQHLRLSDNHNPGTGRRRLFTGKDLIGLSALQAVTRIGFPMNKGNALAILIGGYLTRIRAERAAGIKSPHFALAMYPAEDMSDWAFAPIIDGKEQGVLPVACHVLDVTRLIDEAVAKLEAIIADAPVPSFAPPQPPERPENEYAPYDNRMKLWVATEDGGWRYAGLTPDETKILMAEDGVELVGDDIRFIERKRHPDRDLIRDLMARREDARLDALAADRKEG